LRLPIALTLVLLVSAILPGSAAAGDSPHPLPDYRPAFVTQTESPRPWNDCLWASAAMYLDKLTAGRLIVGPRHLRGLSRDREGGSTFADLRRAFQRLGLPLMTSPNGGDAVTWGELTRRLEAGSGAILLGDYSRLPRRYARWDPSLWRAEGADDNHAIYVDAYERATDRVFVMDPLGRGGFSGEWMPARAVRAFTWRTGSGRLWAAVTPPALPAPFSDVRLEAPEANLDDPFLLDVRWRIAEAPEGWRMPPATLDLEVLAAPDPLDPMIPTLVARGSTLAGITDSDGENPDAAARELPWPAGTMGPLRLEGSELRVTLPVPTEPGAYSLGGPVISARFGAAVPGLSLDPLTVFVPGPRRAEVDLPPGGVTLRAGMETSIPIVLRNTGGVDWASMPTPDGDAPVFRRTRLVALWVSAGTETARRFRLDLGTVGLRPGASEERTLDIRTPNAPGRWYLVIDLEDVDVGSFAAAGSPPAVLAVVVVPWQAVPD
jgi:hypothetical protein